MGLGFSVFGGLGFGEVIVTINLLYRDLSGS